MKRRPQFENCSRCGLPCPAHEVILFYGVLPFCPQCAILILANPPETDIPTIDDK
jgi:hypothetical protein